MSPSIFCNCSSSFPISPCVVLFRPTPILRYSVPHTFRPVRSPHVQHVTARFSVLELVAYHHNRRQLSLLSWAGEQMCRAHEISLNDLARTCLSHLDMDEVVSAKTLLALKILDGTLTKKATLATCRNWQRPTSSSPTCRQTGAHSCAHAS